MTRRWQRLGGLCLLASVALCAGPAQAQGLRFLSMFGESGSGIGRFNRPSGVAVRPDGTILVADTGNNRIQLFDAKGSFLSAFGSEGSGDGQLSGPTGVAVSPDGRILVADTGNHRIQVLDGVG